MDKSLNDHFIYGLVKRKYNLWEDSDNYPLSNKENAHFTEEIFNSIVGVLDAFIRRDARTGFVNKKHILVVMISPEKYIVKTSGRFASNTKYFTKKELKEAFIDLSKLNRV